MSVYEICANSSLFAKFRLNRDHVGLRCSKWGQIPDRTGIVKAYSKFSRQPGLERVVRVVERRTKEVSELEQVKQPITIAEAEKITENMISSFSTNKMMRELIESASLFAGAENIGGARCMRKSRLQITKFERYIVMHALFLFFLDTMSLRSDFERMHEDRRNSPSQLPRPVRPVFRAQPTYEGPESRGSLYHQVQQMAHQPVPGSPYHVHPSSRPASPYQAHPVHQTGSPYPAHPVSRPASPYQAHPGHQTGSPYQTHPGSRPASTYKAHPVHQTGSPYQVHPGSRPASPYQAQHQPGYHPVHVPHQRTPYQAEQVSPNRGYPIHGHQPQVKHSPYQGYQTSNPPRHSPYHGHQAQIIHSPYHGHGHATHMGNSPFQASQPHPVYQPYPHISPLKLPPSRKRMRSSTGSSQAYSVDENDYDTDSVVSSSSSGSDSIHSSDSEFEDESEDDSADLRGFIDFDPKFNRARISKRKRITGNGDDLHAFLYEAPAKPRKWFKRLTQTTVGAKLAR